MRLYSAARAGVNLTLSPAKEVVKRTHIHCLHRAWGGLWKGRWRDSAKPLLHGVMDLSWGARRPLTAFATLGGAV